MQLKFIIITIALVFLLVRIDAQAIHISGKVVDAQNSEPLAFVNITYDESGKGTMTNIDGIFSFELTAIPKSLLFSYVGYKKKKIEIKNISQINNLIVKLKSDPISIDEIVIVPGINPAHRIIKLVSENRINNHPQKLPSFSYVAYDKMIFTTDMDSLSTTKKTRRRNKTNNINLEEDSTDKEVRNILNNQYLMIMEAITSRKYEFPNKDKEQIIASRISGFEKPSFVFLARQFQPFSFYDNLITIIEKKYINPISSGSIDKYFFQLKDTTFTETNDTVFIISFQPKKGKNFNGLQGVLYINSNKWAVQNVIAEATDAKEGILSVKFQQKYSLLENKYWFPEQLNTTLIFNSITAETNTRKLKIIAQGKSYILNRKINASFSKYDFVGANVEFNKNAHLMPEEIWNMYRVQELNEKELETYRTIDSIGRELHFDKTFFLLESIMTGYFPGRFFDIDIRSIVKYNNFEGFRLGIGGKTSKNISDNFSIGGHVAYGFKDRNWKYGGKLILTPYWDKDFFLKFSYINDLQESAGYKFLEEYDLTSSEIFRNTVIKNMDFVTQTKIEWQGKLFKYLKVNTFASKETVISSTDYLFLYEEIPTLNYKNIYNFTEIGFKTRFALGEEYMESAMGNKFIISESKYPVLFLNLTKSLREWDGEFDYTKVEGKILVTINTKTLGRTNIQLVGGMVDGIAPYSKLYNGHGSYQRFGVEMANSFNTMRVNEFLSDNFVSLYFAQNFEKLLFKNKFFSPEIILINNIGFGNLGNKQYHINYNYLTMEKGYYECGLLINKIIKNGLFGFGLGAFYRYGPYSFSNTIDNFAFKLTFRINY